MTEEGIYKIVNGDIESLKVFYKQNKLLNYNLPSNIIFLRTQNKGLKSNDCNSGKRKSGYKTSGDKRIKWVISHMTYPWGDRVVVAKTKNYEKKRRRWKKYRTYCVAQVKGYIAGTDANGNPDCTVKIDINPSNYYAYETSKKKVKHKIFVLTKTKSSWIKGYHFGAGKVSYNSVLTW